MANQENKTQRLHSAINLVLRDALDRVDVHPCDESNDSVRVNGLSDELKELYLAFAAVDLSQPENTATAKFSQKQVITHKKGGLYIITAMPDQRRLESSNTPFYEYLSLDDGQVWLRDQEEMEDGRFTTTTQEKNCS